MRSVSHLHYPLDHIFSASSHILILRVLQDSREGMSGRSIAREAHINHQSCAVSIKNLESFGILQRRGSGKTQLIRLNFDNILVKNALIPLLRQERELLMKVKEEIVKTFKDDALTITLFGSTARKQDVLGSDIDFLLVIKGTRKNQIQDKAITHGSAFIRRYGVRLSPIIMTVSEIKERIKKADTLVKNILTDGIDLLSKKLREITL